MARCMIHNYIMHNPTSTCPSQSRHLHTPLSMIQLEVKCEVGLELGSLYAKREGRLPKDHQAVSAVSCDCICQRYGLFTRVKSSSRHCYRVCQCKSLPTLPSHHFQIQIVVNLPEPYLSISQFPQSSNSLPQALYALSLNPLEFPGPSLWTTPYGKIRVAMFSLM